MYGNGPNAAIRVSMLTACRVCAEAIAQQEGKKWSLAVSMVPDFSRAGIEQVSRSAPQVLLIDLRAPGGGFDLSAKLRPYINGAKFVFFSARASDICLKQALVLGAAGFLLKQETAAQLVAHIEQIVAGEARFSPPVAERLEYDLERRTYRLKDATAIDSFTPTQLEILRHLARGASVKEVAARMSLSRKSVDGHKYRIMKKLDIDDRVVLSRFAIREGLIEA